jgi:uncharacterized membrane protein
MKDAVLVDLTNMLLWFFSALLGGVTYVREKTAVSTDATAVSTDATADGAAAGHDGENNVRMGPMS